MPASQFYLEWFKLAFLNRWGIADSIAGFLAITAALISQFYPELQPTMSTLAWQVALAIFIGLALIGLVRAPYVIYRKLAAEKKELEIRLKETEKASEEALQRYATPEQLVGRHIVGIDFRATDLARESDLIRNKTFEGCTIYGPAVIFPTGDNLINCTWETPNMNPDAMLIEIPASKKELVGVIAFQECTFISCHFRRIALIGTRSQLEDFKRNVKPDIEKDKEGQEEK